MSVHLSMSTFEFALVMCSVQWEVMRLHVYLLWILVNSLYLQICYILQLLIQLDFSKSWCMCLWTWTCEQFIFGTFLYSLSMYLETISLLLIGEMQIKYFESTPRDQNRSHLCKGFQSLYVIEFTLSQILHYVLCFQLKRKI